jgi:hypothetical protein
MIGIRVLRNPLYGVSHKEGMVRFTSGEKVRIRTSYQRACGFPASSTSLQFAPTTADDNRYQFTCDGTTWWPIRKATSNMTQIELSITQITFNCTTSHTPTAFDPSPAGVPTTNAVVYAAPPRPF